MILLTERLSLQKYNPSDFEDFCEVICSDEVMKNISGKGNTIEVAKEKFDWVLKLNKEHQHYGLYKVVLKETNNTIGFAKITPFEKDVFEIGYALLPDYWRKGFTIEMIRKMTRHCQEHVPKNKIMAVVNIENLASIKVLEKCNYKIYKELAVKESPCYLMEHTI